MLKERKHRHKGGGIDSDTEVSDAISNVRMPFTGLFENSDKSKIRSPPPAPSIGMAVAYFQESVMQVKYSVVQQPPPRGSDEAFTTFPVCPAGHPACASRLQFFGPAITRPTRSPSWRVPPEVGRQERAHDEVPGLYRASPRR